MPPEMKPNQPPVLNNIDSTLQQALALHQKGNYQAAQTLYQTILKQDPNHVDALQLYGTAALQQNELETAEQYLSTALSLNPKLLNPLMNLVRTLEAREKYTDAINRLSQALTIEPRSTFYLHRASLYKKLNTLALAAQDYETAISKAPQNWSAYLSAGEIWQTLGEMQRAIDIYNKGILAKPDFLEAWVNKAIALQALAQLDEALIAHEIAIKINPNFHITYFNQAVLFDKLLRYEDAIDSYTKVLELQPDFVEALCNRGNSYMALKNLHSAEIDYRNALKLTPDNYLVWSNLGIVLKSRQEYEQAIEYYKKAISLKHDFTDTYCNLGNALCLIGQHEAALDWYKNGLNIHPNNTELAWCYSLALLRIGNFQTGWTLYEKRWEGAQPKIVRLMCSQPQWTGKETLEGKTIFIHWEQGLGDTIQFCQLIKQVKSLGATIMMAVQPPLERLLQYNLKDVDIWITELTQVPEFDYYIHLLSLPTVLKLSLSQLPAMQNYIRAEPEYIEKWQQKLGTTSKPRIGLVWQGGQQHKETHLRNLSLQKLLPHLSTDYEFIVLQKEIREEDHEILKHQKHLSFYGDEIKDFSDTAALCHLSDWIISIDTSVAHLAGAMGKPCYLILPFCPDFRWLLDRSDSPWYPSMTLFRQIRHGEWDDVLVKLFAAAAQKIKTLSAHSQVYSETST